jgi:tetratricopeptide (TPR) repeat protein
MYMRKACATCLLLAAAHLGRGQTDAMERQWRMWSEYSALVSNSDAVERQRIFANSGRDKSVPSEERISVARLLHQAPRKAQSLFSRGVKFANAGDFTRAAHDFERAVTIDPKYSEAHGNLGVMFIDLNLLDQAASEFRLAVQQDPADSSYHANLALALILLRLPKEAEPEAQTAFDLDHSNAKARYLLGCLLARRPETRSKAAEHLEYAAQQVPDAHLILADLYRREGADALAQLEKERYRKAILAAVKTP